MYYFGAADELKGALDRYERERPYLEAGRTPPEESPHQGQHVTMADLCNHFLTSKLHKLENGELAASTFDDYRQTCDKVINHFGRSRRVDESHAHGFSVVSSGNGKDREVGDTQK